MHLTISNFGLPENSAEEAGTVQQIILWIPTTEAGNWLRVATNPGVPIASAEALQFVAAEAMEMRLQQVNWLARLRSKIVGTDTATWQTPDGQPAEPIGTRQKGLYLIWSSNQDAPVAESDIEQVLDEAVVFRRLGSNLLLARGKPVAGEPSSQSKLGSESSDSTKLPDALEHASAALKAAERSDEPALRTVALIDLGAALVRTGQAAEAVPKLEEARDLARQQHDLVAERDALMNLGACYLELGRGDDALAAFQAVLSSAREAADRYAEKMALSEFGTTFTWALAPERALPYYQAAYQIAVELGDQRDQADLLWRMAVCFDELGDRNSAVQSAQQSIELLRAMGNPDAESFDRQLRMLQINPQTQLAESHNSKTPSVLRQAFTAAAAFAKFAGSGFKKVDPPTREARLAICNRCDLHTGVRCRACGCFTAQKTWLPHERCPLGKWPV